MDLKVKLCLDYVTIVTNTSFHLDQFNDLALKINIQKKKKEREFSDST